MFEMIVFDIWPNLIIVCVLLPDWSEQSSSVSSDTTTDTSSDSDETSNESAEMSTDTDDKRKTNRPKRRRHRQVDIFSEHYDTGTIVRAAGKYIIRPVIDGTGAKIDKNMEDDNVEKEISPDNDVDAEVCEYTQSTPSGSGGGNTLRKLFAIKQGRSHGRQAVSLNSSDGSREIDTFPFATSNELPLDGINSRPPFRPHKTYRESPYKSFSHKSHKTKRNRNGMGSKSSFPLLCVRSFKGNRVHLLKLVRISREFH